MRNLLIVGHGANNTGFARISVDIASSLCPYLKVSHFAINTYKNEPYSKDVSFIPNSDIDDPYGYTQINDIITNSKVDLVLIVHDLWNIPQYLKNIKATSDKCKIVAYCPVDGLISDKKLISDLEELDGLIVYNNFAFDQINSIYDKPLFVVPHCINDGFFVKQDRVNDFLNREAFKIKVFDDQICLKSSFVILNANRNTHRKRIDLTIRAFEIFANEKDDVFLCLLSEGDTSPFIRNVNSDIKKKIIYPFTGDGHQLSINQLNILYNACDVGVNTSMGEGWGLISFEHALTGAAQIIPDHSSGTELWKDYGLLIKSHVSYPESPINLSVIDVDDLVAHLNLLYSNRDSLHTISKRCYNRAINLKEDTNSYHTQWLYIFDNI